MNLRLLPAQPPHKLPAGYQSLPNNIHYVTSSHSPGRRLRYLLYCFCQLDGRPEAEQRVLPRSEEVKRDAAKWAYEVWEAQ